MNMQKTDLNHWKAKFNNLFPKLVQFCTLSAGVNKENRQLGENRSLIIANIP